MIRNQYTQLLRTDEVGTICATYIERTYAADTKRERKSALRGVINFLTPLFDKRAIRAVGLVTDINGDRYVAVTLDTANAKD